MTWDTSSASIDDNEEIYARAMQIADAPWPQDLQTVASGDVEQQYQDSNTDIVVSNYRFPYLAHACMEPMNCTAQYHSETNSLDIWAPTRQPGITLKLGRECVRHSARTDQIASNAYGRVIWAPAFARLLL